MDISKNWSTFVSVIDTVVSSDNICRVVSEYIMELMDIFVFYEYIKE